MLQQDEALSQLRGRDQLFPNTAPHDPPNRNVHPPDLPSLSSPGASNSQLACPFYKFNPVLCDGCENLQFVKISDMKQHLVHFHSQEELPAFSCTVCHSPFVDEPSKMLHLHDGSCCIAAAPEKLSHQEVIKLKETKFTPGTSAASQWSAIWKQLFPGHPEPETPYKESNHIKEVFRLLTPYLEKAFLAAYPTLDRVLRQSNISFKELMADIYLCYCNSLPVSRQGPSVDRSRAGISRMLNVSIA